MTINCALLLLIGFHRIPFGESKVLKSSGIKLPKAIFGGKVANLGQFPYAVSLQRYHKNSGQYKPICGGSLITTTAILSAAHCVVRSGYLIGNINDYIGVLDTVDAMNRSNHVIFKDIYIHPKYNETLLWNDIAFLAPSKRVKLGYTVKTIPLIGEGLSIVGMRGIALGWGKTDYRDVDGSRMLRYADIDIVSIEVCKNYYDNLNQNEMCYGTEGKGICKGDSGGPVVVRLRNVEVQVGIASYSDRLCSGVPSAGTNLRSFNSWIRNNVKGTPDFIG